MDERLRNLKRSMKKTMFSDLNFTEKHKNQVRDKIARLNIKSEEELVLDILHLLNQKQTGFELTQWMRARGIHNYENNEGQLYMLLHQLEQKGYLQTNWHEDEKYYLVTNKGNKLLSLADKRRMSTKSIFKELWEG